jgi:hypothetical protein
LQSNCNWKLLIALARRPHGRFQHCLVRLLCYSSTCTQSSATFRIHLAKIPPSILLQLQSNCYWKLLIALARCPHGRFQHCLVRLLCYSSTCMHSSATFHIHLTKIPPSILLQLQSNLNWKLLIALARCPNGRFQHCLVRLICYSSTCTRSFPYPSSQDSSFNSASIAVKFELEAPHSISKVPTWPFSTLFGKITLP